MSREYCESVLILYVPCRYNIKTSRTPKERMFESTLCDSSRAPKFHTRIHVLTSRSWLLVACWSLAGSLALVDLEPWNLHGNA
jgi:hypothetical protein